MKYDLKHVTDFIFSDKSSYDKLSCEDKESLFFIVNRKFTRRYPKHAKLLNNKSIDKPSALDIWYYYFIKIRLNGIPKWYWFKQKTKKDKSILKSDERDYYLKQYDISDKDLDFIEKNYTNELKEELKLYKKYNKD